MGRFTNALRRHTGYTGSMFKKAAPYVAGGALGGAAYNVYTGEKEAMKNIPGPAPIAYDTSAWDRMGEQGRSTIAGKYGTFRQSLQAGLSARGAGRSGFLGTGLARLGADEEMERAGLLGDLAMQRQQFEQALASQSLAEYQQRLMEEQAKWDRRMAAVSAGLGAAGQIAAGWGGRA